MPDVNMCISVMLLGKKLVVSYLCMMHPMQDTFEPCPMHSRHGTSCVDDRIVDDRIPFLSRQSVTDTWYK